MCGAIAFLLAYTQLTLSPTPSHFSQYGNKQWAGLTQAYYRKRYDLLAVRVAEGIRSGKGVNATAYAADLGALGEAWTRGKVEFPSSPVGDAVAVGRALYTKYAT